MMIDRQRKQNVRNRLSILTININTENMRCKWTKHIHRLQGMNILLDKKIQREN